MKTVHEVSEITGVSIRTLHYYDKIGILHPKEKTDAGYRLYDDAALERLQHILLFRELEFSLKEIKHILDSPNFDRNKALEQQITLLQLKKEHIENLIDLARGIKLIGVKHMDFSVFDTKKLDEYARQAKESWGETEAFKEFEEKNRKRSEMEVQNINVGFIKLFQEFGSLIHLKPESPEVQQQVNKHQEYITEHFYTCTPKMLKALGMMYVGGGDMTENIDKWGGKGTAEFIHRAIEVFCQSH